MKLAPLALFVALPAAAFAQPGDIFRGRVTGASNDRGKCTVEILVDGVIEVEVAGADGRAAVLSGARPQWRRLQCNMPLPPNPAAFRFRPQTGRGTQTLLREPVQNRGTAVIRIEDPASGSEGYKFDLEWRGVESVRSGDFGRAGAGGVIRPDDPGLAGWNSQIDYSGRGDGYYRDFRGSDELLREASVRIDRAGRVEVRLTTGRRERILLTGLLMQANRRKLSATMTSGPIQGLLEIFLDNRDRVQELAMTGTGRNRLELRWQFR